MRHSIPIKNSDGDEVLCLKCLNKVAVWEKYGYWYCEDCKPENEDAFDPEEAETNVINLFKD